MLTYTSPDHTVFALVNRTANTVAATVQIFCLGQLVDASGIGDDIETALTQATQSLIPSMPSLGAMSIDGYIELAANQLKSLDLN
jgi:hypothetical protein